jgi:hypothetical protein
MKDDNPEIRQQEGILRTPAKYAEVAERAATKEARTQAMRRGEFW